MKPRRFFLPAALALALAALTAHAHHGWSEYDSSKSLTLTGKILESGYEHPHGHVRLETPGKTWLVILAPPSRMERRGLSKEMLKPGSSATVSAPSTRAPATSSVTGQDQPVLRRR